MAQPRCTRGPAIGSDDKGHSPSDQLCIRNAHNQAGGPFAQDPQHACRRSDDHQGSGPLLSGQLLQSRWRFSASRLRFPQTLSAPRSTSCDEDQVRPSEQPTDAQCRAIHVIGRGRNTALRYVDDHRTLSRSSMGEWWASCSLRLMKEMTAVTSFPDWPDGIKHTRSPPPQLMIACGCKSHPAKAAAGEPGPSLAGVAATRGLKCRQDPCGVRE